MIHARMRAGGDQVDVCIRDISSRGMLLQSSVPPSRGTYVEIVRPGHRIIGRVIWAKARRFGIMTQDRMNVQSIIDQGAIPVSVLSTVAAGTPLLPSRSTRPSKTRRRDARDISTLAQFVVAVACGGMAAATLASLVYEMIARPVAEVSAGLGLTP